MFCEAGNCFFESGEYVFSMTKLHLRSSLIVDCLECWCFRVLDLLSVNIDVHVRGMCFLLLLLMI